MDKKINRTIAVLSMIAMFLLGMVVGIITSFFIDTTPPDTKEQQIKIYKYNEIERIINK